MIEGCTAIVFAGGKSRRMGQDKASLVLGQSNDETLLQKVLALVQPLFASVVVSVDRLRPELALTQVCDAHVGAGPLAGLYAGLKRSATPWVFAIATDMPFVRAALIEKLAKKRGAFDAVIPLVDGHAQALLGFYSQASLAPIEALLAADGRRSMRALLEQLNVCYVEESEIRTIDPDLRSFFDLDTPEDVVAARQGERLLITTHTTSTTNTTKFAQ